MDADEEERDLYAEFLENWNTPTPIPTPTPTPTPIYSDQNPLPHFDAEKADTSKQGPIYSDQNPLPHFDVVEADTSKQGDILPVLVRDTYYDKVLGHATDGIDIAALLNPSPCFSIPVPITIPFPIPVPRAVECGHVPATKTEFSQCDFIRKLGVMLYSNK